MDWTIDCPIGPSSWAIRGLCAAVVDRNGQSALRGVFMGLSFAFHSAFQLVSFLCFSLFHFVFQFASVGRRSVAITRDTHFNKVINHGKGREKVVVAMTASRAYQ